MNKVVLLIDDDEIVNWVITKMIKKTDADPLVKSFAKGQEALDYLGQHYNEENFYYIFLDINMPTFNGWDFLEALKKIETIKSNFVSIYLLSSSVDPNDKEKAKSYDLVKGYFIKPLSFEKIKTIFD